MNLFNIERMYIPNLATNQDELPSQYTNEEGPRAIPIPIPDLLTSPTHRAGSYASPGIAAILFSNLGLQSGPSALEAFRDQVSPMDHYRQTVDFSHQALRVDADTQTVFSIDHNSHDALAHFRRTADFSGRARHVEVATQTPQDASSWHYTPLSIHLLDFPLEDYLAENAGEANLPASPIGNSRYIDLPSISSRPMTIDLILGDDAPYVSVDGAQLLEHSVITNGPVSALMFTSGISGDGVHDQRRASMGSIFPDLANYDHGVPSIPLHSIDGLDLSMHAFLRPLQQFNRSQWENLTRLDVGLVTINECLSILQVCSNLIKLTLKVSPPETPPPERPTVHVNQLTHLVINPSDNCDPRELFDHINAARLKSFELTGLPYFRDFPDLMTRLAFMLNRSRAQLQTLALFEAYPVEKQLVEALKTKGSCITHLIIDTKGLRHTTTASSDGRAISDYLLEHIATRNFCPNLTMLQLSPCLTSDGKLSRAAEARQLASIAYSFVDCSSHLLDIALLSTPGECEVTYIL